MAEMREGMNLTDISVLFGVSYLFFLYSEVRVPCHHKKVHVCYLIS